VALGEELRVPFEDTWSCYDPVHVRAETPIYTYSATSHCGVCGTCRERKMAFEAANVYDPTRYAK